MSDDEMLFLNDFLTRHEWTYSKSMPKTPHDYIVREEINSDAEFDLAVILIRKYGEAAYFFKKKLVYLLLGDYYYWTMGSPVAETVIINRASTKVSRIINGRMCANVLQGQDGI